MSQANEKTPLLPVTVWTVGVFAFVGLLAVWTPPARVLQANEIPLPVLADGLLVLGDLFCSALGMAVVGAILVLSWVPLLFASKSRVLRATYWCLAIAVGLGAAASWLLVAQPVQLAMEHLAPAAPR